MPKGVKMKKNSKPLIILILILMSYQLFSQEATENRYALVIGNGDYTYLPKLKKSAFASGPRTERICTEIVLKNNYLIFGTFADVNMFFNNYYFHCIELLTGIEKNKKIQVGAGCHTWYNDTLFANGLEGNLLQLNLLENKIVQQIEFKEGKMSKNSPITIFDNKICTLVKNEEGQSSIIFLKQ